MKNKTIRFHLRASLVAFLFLANASLAMCFAEDPAFTLTGSMTAARTGHTATLLQNGKVLIVGGATNGLIYSSAELYDPITGTFSATGSMSKARWGHTATLLHNGKVLITGGSDNASLLLAEAELYEPTTGNFTQIGSMNTARGRHAATLLDNGKVLITGGDSGSSMTTDTAELYDPDTGAFSATGNLVITRAQHRAILLPNGKALIVGGGNWTGERVLTSAELYDPATETFTQTGSMSTGRYAFAAIRLLDGKVLVAGGYKVSNAEIYDPETGLFSPTGSMNRARSSLAATLLPNGKALILGGVDAYSQSVLASTEIYDPATGDFSTAVDMNEARYDSSATLMQNGKVLVAGGADWQNIWATAELYSDSTTVPNHTITFIEGTGGTISGSKIQTVPDGGSSTPVQAVPNNGYALANWTGTGGFSSTDNPLTVNNVTTDMTITANFNITQIDVTIDVKPGETPNSINPRNKGKIPVAIITTSDFSAGDVAPTSVHFGKTGNEASASHWSLVDVNGDGQIDLLLHFPTRDTGILCDDTQVFLTGKTHSGVSIKGEDKIRTVGCK